MRQSSSKTYRVNAIERALGLLHCVADAALPQTLSGIAQAAKIAIPTAFRYLSILERAGYVERDPQTRRYTLGLSAAALAMRAEPNAGLRRVAPLALDGVNDFQGILHLAVVRGARLYHIERMEIGARILDSSCVGISYDPLGSVAGRALVCGLEGPQREIVAQRSPPAARRGLEDAVGRASSCVSEHGFYCDALDPVSSLMCVAVPVPGAGGRLPFAACVTVSALRRNGSYPERLVARSAQIARRIAATIVQS